MLNNPKMSFKKQYIKIYKRADAILFIYVYAYNYTFIAMNAFECISKTK